MPASCRLLPATIAAAAALCAVAPLAASDRYVAWLADGTRITGPFIPAWPVPGEPYRFENQDLLTSQNLLRLMRDRTVQVELRAPYVVLANGDVLSGVPIGLEPSLGRVTDVPRVKVQLEPPLMPVTGTTLAVRSDRILRIVVAGGGELPPGAVRLADGRQFAARSIRWREAGLAVLTSAGIEEVPFGDMAEVAFPGIERTAAVLDDNAWAAATTAAVLTRYQMAGGAVLTTARVRRQIETSRRGRSTTNVNYYVQPAWAEQPLALPELQVAWVSCRRADEAPLSLFPAATLASERLLGQVEPWLANRSPGNSLLAAGPRESDLGIAAHAHSAIAFDLPPGSRSLESAVGLDKSVGHGGCVRCQIVAEGGTGAVLWDSGIFQGRDGLRLAAAIDVRGLSRVVLVTDYAHADRPAGADPLDIRDQVAWLAPLIKLEPPAGGPGQRLSRLLPDLSDWELSGPGWTSARLESRWHPFNRGWDPLLTLPRGAELRLTRKLRVTRTSDVLELLTACPRNLDEHDLTLTVNGTEVDAASNDDRRELHNRVQRFGRFQSRDDEDERRYADRLAYWWDLSRWRGQEVSLELTIRGERERSEIAWRGLALRCPIGNMPAAGEPLKSQVALLSVEPDRLQGKVLPNAIPTVRSGETIRFLGQPFVGGYGMARSSTISFPLEASYRKFVAVAGSPYQSTGPMQVLIDDRIVWERLIVSSLTPAEQIEIDIPPGAKRLTLQNGKPDGSPYGYAAFAEAGFVTE